MEAAVAVESAVLSVPCPVDDCTAMIPLRATLELVTDGNYVLEFTSTAIRAHVLLSHRFDPSPPCPPKDQPK